jgi:hypothetical protein
MTSFTDKLLIWYAAHGLREKGKCQKSIMYINVTFKPRLTTELAHCFAGGLPINLQDIMTQFHLNDGPLIQNIIQLINELRFSLVEARRVKSTLLLFYFN